MLYDMQIQFFATKNNHLSELVTLCYTLVTRSDYYYAYLDMLLPCRSNTVSSASNISCRIIISPRVDNEIGWLF